MIVTNTSEGHLYVVSNAGCWDKDLALMQVQPLCSRYHLSHSQNSTLTVQKIPGMDKGLRQWLFE